MPTLEEHIIDFTSNRYLVFLYKLNTIALKVIGDTEVEVFLDKGFLTGAWLFKLCDLSF